MWAKVEGLRALWRFDNFAELLLKRLLWRYDGALMYRIGGMEILVDHDAGDASGTRMVLASDMYRRLLPHLRVAGSPSVLDLGANGGGFPLLLALHGISCDTVCCVEMHPNTYRRAVINTEANLPGCRLAHRNAALNADGRCVEVDLAREGTGESIYAVPAPDAQTVAVPGITLEALIDEVFGGRVPEIIKMDIEGAEHEILRDESCAPLRRCRYLIIEIHRLAGTDVQIARDRLASLGLRDITPPGTAADVYLFEGPGSGDEPS